MDRDELEAVMEKITEIKKEVGQVNQKADDLQKEVKELRNYYNEVDKKQASLEQTIYENIDARLSKIEKTLSKVNWLVVSAVVIAVLNLIIVSNGNGGD